MKSVLIILDGVSEEKTDVLHGMTPLEYACTPTIDSIVKKGIHKKTSYCVEGREPDSLSCILSALGVDSGIIPRNRAYFEALASGINVGVDDVVLRCNLISVAENRIESFNGRGLTSWEMRDISNKVNVPDGLKFHHLTDYRSLMVMKSNREIQLLEDIAPHENIGINISELFRGVGKIDLLNYFIEANMVFIRGREYMFYPWGVAEKSYLPSFFNLYGRTCSCICGAEIMKGIAKAMGMNVPELKNATGDVDTDLREKAKAVLDELKKNDSVIAHINGSDESAHRMNLQEKISFIEKTDREFLKVIYENIENTSLTIVSDHQTSSITGKHEKGPVDYISNIREEFTWQR